MNTQASTDAQESHTKDVTITVNGREKIVEKRKYSFDEIVRLAFPSPNPNFEYAVTYSRGEHPQKEGTLVSGQSVNVKEGMKFDVTETNKS